MLPPLVFFLFHFLETSFPQPARLTNHTFTAFILLYVPTAGTTQVSNVRTPLKQDIVAISHLVMQYPQRQVFGFLSYSSVWSE